MPIQHRVHGVAAKLVLAGVLEEVAPARIALMERTRTGLRKQATARVCGQVKAAFGIDGLDGVDVVWGHGGLRGKWGWRGWLDNRSQRLHAVPEGK